MRLFVGIALPPVVSDSLERIRQRFESGSSLPGADPPIRWSAPEGWHVTLQFLGAVSHERVTCVHEQLRIVRAASVPVRIQGLGLFERAGVFWAGVSLTPELLALQQLVAAAMRQCGFIPEDRAYNPHITLARTRGHAGAKALGPLKKAVGNKAPDLRAEFTAEEFLLYESFPGPECSRYEVRARFPLAPTP